MAPDEYSAGGGGKLKLKGSKVSDGRVEKKKKKKGGKKVEAQADAAESGSEAKDRSGQSGRASAEPEKGGGSETHELGDRSAAKTEAERRYEEVRRKRLQDRLQREGIKTHKERVEELNKYLSRLSEHHDMPKIGPG